MGERAERTINRRRFLVGTAAAGIGAVTHSSFTAAATTSPSAPSRAQRIPLRREEHRVVIVGSGFGGGVAALRLAQAGVRTVVLERGRRWATGPNSDTFPTTSSLDARALRCRSAPQLFGRPFAVDPYVGLIEAVIGTNMTALCAAGVGGGSPVYQGMSLQPSEEVFYDWFPSGIDWAAMNTVHYPEVARMLRLATAPDSLIASPTYQAPRVFAERAARAGLPVEKIPMPIDWDYALAELRGDMKPAYTSGDGALGVNNGGKHTVDVTYIAEAERTGLADVRTQHEVVDIARHRNGRWEVHVHRIDDRGDVVENLILEAGTLILAAGSINTTKLLVRAHATGTITALPDDVGKHWGTNADRIYLWTDPSAGFGDKQGGPVVFGSLNWSERQRAHTMIQASIPALPINTHSTVMVGYGVSADRGHFRYDHRQDQAVLEWPRGGDDHIVHTAIAPTARAIAGSTGFLTDTNAIAPSTWHPLGGANIDKVCDLSGRVLGQRGLYVLDGALMPGTAAACNPSMTIAALAEYALADITKRDVGPII
ncbi:MAG: FAD-binding protein [Rhodococcus sp.]|nr:FAD-binding protein [Rhodococcus sp. (in: high G+C Gram-positive bacteria)]